jgi:colanic acid biosynthesis glycosyl transferase WcaI
MTPVAVATERPAPPTTSPPSDRLWIVSELYYPEETSTGHVLTSLAEELAARHDVHVLCGQPTYSRRGLRAPVSERRQGVEITRCSGLTLDKDVLPFRLANMSTLALSTFAHAALKFRRNDVVIVVTNPPVLPFLIGAACALRGARCILLIHDVYPDAPIVAGLLRAEGVVARWIGRATAVLYRRVAHICVLGRDMALLVRAKAGALDPSALTVLPNWASDPVLDSDPTAGRALLADLGLDAKFVVEYAGNIGKVHGIEALVDAAAELARTDPQVHLLFIGSGAKRAWLVEQVRQRSLPNVTILPPKSREEEPVFLHACHLAVMSFVPGMAGVGVPSRLYNILAAGVPVVAAVDASSEPALVITEERVGWVVAPGDAAGIASAIREACRNPVALDSMAARARLAARNKYTLARVAAGYERVIERVRTI